MKLKSMASSRSNESKTTASLENGTEQSFETLMEGLSGIVSRLEKGEVSLEDSLKLYEDGVRLTRLGQEKISAAEKKIEHLKSNFDEKGTKHRGENSKED